MGASSPPPQKTYGQKMLPIYGEKKASHEKKDDSKKAPTWRKGPYKEKKRAKRLPIGRKKVAEKPLPYREKYLPDFPVGDHHLLLSPPPPVDVYQK